MGIVYIDAMNACIPKICYLVMKKTVLQLAGKRNKKCCRNKENRRLIYLQNISQNKNKSLV